MYIKKPQFRLAENRLKLNFEIIKKGSGHHFDNITVL